MQAPGDVVTPCGAYASHPPSADQLFEEGFVNKKLAADLAPRLRATQSNSTALGMECHPAYVYFVQDTSEVYDAVLSHKETATCPTIRSPPGRSYS